MLTIYVTKRHTDGLVSCECHDMMKYGYTEIEGPIITGDEIRWVDGIGISRLIYKHL